MPTLTKQQVADIIQKRPSGSTPEGIIAGLRSKGYALEGYGEEKKTTSTGIANYTSSDPGVFDRIFGTASQILQAPQSILTGTGKMIGGAIGGLSSLLPGGIKPSEGLKIGLDIATEGAKQITGIPRQIASGYTKGFSGAEKMAKPSTELGEEDSFLGFAVDVAGDPLNLLGIKGFKQLATVKNKTPWIQKFGESLYQGLSTNKGKQAKEFSQIGKYFNEAQKLEPELFGKVLPNYGIRGNFETMIKTMNERIPTISAKIKEVADASNDLIKTDVIKNLLTKSAELYSKAGKTKTAQYITKKISEIPDTLKINDAVDLKRVYDELRLTATQGLSNAQSVEQKIYRTISNGLRNSVNNVPGEIGKMNKELTAYYDAIESFSKLAAQDAVKGKLPAKISAFFPYVRLNLKSMPKLKTWVGTGAIQLGKALNVPENIARNAIKPFIPNIIRNIIEQQKD